MDVIGMLKRAGGQSYTVTTASGAGAYDTNTGAFVPGSSTTIQVQGSLQPLSGQELLTIPEGDRTRERWRFYSWPALKNFNNVTLAKSDFVTIGGVNYQVETVWHWNNYSKAILVSVNTDAN